MDDVPLEIYVFDSGDAGPALAAFYNESPLVTLYSHGVVDRRFLATFIRTCCAEIIRQGGDVTADILGDLVTQAFQAWNCDGVDLSWVQTTDKNYLH